MCGPTLSRWWANYWGSEPRSASSLAQHQRLILRGGPLAIWPRSNRAALGP
jgi:hypothetical protein